ncbi:hypothetical protein AX16_009004 [Volvariella volvacea WC 439]|nr:hypothetical protein AX16_009004 [Volvariella volvacea WC 439]
MSHPPTAPFDTLSALGLDSNDDPPKRQRSKTQPANDDTWNSLYESIEQYDGEMLRKLTEEIQNILIYTGLFAATMTAFTIESYKWLESDPADTTAKMLTQISLQLANLSDPTTYSSVLADSLSFDPVPAKSYAYSINTLWFASLSLTLFAAFISVLHLQWLREYRKDMHGFSAIGKNAFSLRQLRYNGLTSWGVPGFIGVLPVLLQIALATFLMGLWLLLATLDSHTAIISFVFIVIGPIYATGTSLLPLYQLVFMSPPGGERVWQCPYKSSIGFAFYYMACLLFSQLRTLLELVLGTAPTICYEFGKCKSWSELDSCWINATSPIQAKYIDHAITWIINIWGHKRTTFDAITKILPSLYDSELWATALRSGLIPRTQPFLGISPTTPVAHEATIFSDSQRDIVELVVLLSFPKESWQSNPANREALFEILEHNITYTPAGLATLPPKAHTRLIEVLSSGFSARAPSPNVINMQMQSMIAFCYHSARRAQEDPVFPQIEFWDLTMNSVLPQTTGFSFIGHSIAAGEPDQEGDDFHFPNLSQLEICSLVLKLSSYGGLWDTSHRNRYYDTVAAYADNISSVALPAFENQNGPDAIRQEWIHFGKTVVEEIQSVAIKFTGILDRIGERCESRWRRFYEAVVWRQHPGVEVTPVQDHSSLFSIRIEPNEADLEE